MILNSPFCITPSLEAGVRIGSDFISIGYAANQPTDGRVRYRYMIMIEGQPDYVDKDLRSGAMGGDLRDGMVSLLSFLGAAAESYRYAMAHDGAGENLDLFPDYINEWAYLHADELAMIQLEIEESADCIVE